MCNSISHFCILFEYVWSLLSLNIKIYYIGDPDAIWRFEMAVSANPPADPPVARAAAALTVAANSIKLPPFWPTGPEVWFTQV